MWTIFKLERQKSGRYMIDLSVDAKWVSRQIKKLKKEPCKVVYVVADSFAEMVYGVKLPEGEKPRYLKGLLDNLGGVSNLENVTYESDLIGELWALDQYIDIASSFIPDMAILEQEKETRRKLYNSKGYQISSEEISKMATMALGCFKAESCLEVRYYQKEVDL